MPDPSYDEFLDAKRVRAADVGFEVPEEDLHPALFPFQRRVVAWALRKGRCALFEECGLGKTLQQLVWADQVCRRITVGDEPARVLTLTPLAVAAQTVAEAERFGIEGVAYHRSQAEADEAGSRIVVANYEMLAHLDPSAYAGVVLDESSILKAYSGKTKRALVEAFRRTPFRLCCTATPAPNDHGELGNHAEFLSVMRSSEMLARWFINDQSEAGNYRLKHHARADFWRWVASWAVALTEPADLGDAFAADAETFRLPGLRLIEHPVPVDHSEAGANKDGQVELLRGGALSATKLHAEMRKTAGDRAARAAELVRLHGGPFAVWVNTNYEADAVRAALAEEFERGEAVEVRGSDPVAAKQERLEAFADGRARVIVTKPTVAGFGLNWQHCARMAFVGLSYSYEQLYQALRRSYRFGQTQPVEAHVVTAESEQAVLSSINEKMEAHAAMQREMAAATREVHDLGASSARAGTATDAEIETATGGPSPRGGASRTLHRGDCVEALRTRVAPGTVGLSVFSPPFAELYIYSDHERDMGNARDYGEFFEHFGFLLPELLRATTPGRLAVVHCKDLPLYRGRDGAMGLRDFPGDLRRAFEAADAGDGSRWVFHSRVTVWKDPVVEMQRTKNHGLLYKELCKDSTASRQGMADYLMVFRKWSAEASATGQFPDPVFNGTPGAERFAGAEGAAEYVGEAPPLATGDARLDSIHVWQRYASPVWFDVNQMDVLNYLVAKGDRDEKHICPLQLDLIRRAVHLWSNPGDLVLDPFAGIGSTGYVAVEMGRRFVGAELKPSYFEHALRHLRAAEAEANAPTLFQQIEEAA